MFKIFKSELLKVVNDFKAYWIEYSCGNVSAIFLFIGLFYSLVEAKVLQANYIQYNFFVIGLLIWYFGSNAFNLIAMNIEDEYKYGTIENLLKTKTNILIIMLNRLLVQFLFDLFRALIIFPVCIIIFNLKINLELNLIFVLKFGILFLISILWFYAFSIIIAGISLFNKRITSLTLLFNYLLLFFMGITIPLSSLPLFIQKIGYIFPLIYVKLSLESSMILNLFFDKYLTYLCLYTVSFLLVSVVFFQIMIKKSKKYGKFTSY